MLMGRKSLILPNRPINCVKLLEERQEGIEAKALRKVA